MGLGVVRTGIARVPARPDPGLSPLALSPFGHWLLAVSLKQVSLWFKTYNFRRNLFVDFRLKKSSYNYKYGTRVSTRIKNK